MEQCAGWCCVSDAGLVAAVEHPCSPGPGGGLTTPRPPGSWKELEAGVGVLVGWLIGSLFAWMDV